MASFRNINFSLLPAPEIIEQVDYDTILAEMVESLRSLDPTFTATVESDPAYKILEVAALREFLLREQFNERAKGAFLAYAKGGDLEHLAAFFRVPRLVVDEGDSTVIPPIPPTMESDESLRKRAQLALEAFSTAGSEGAYIFHALSVPGVKDVAVSSPNAGDVQVAILSLEGAGDADAALIAAVDAALSEDDVRPLTDNVTVVAAGIVPYEITATVYVLPGPDMEVVRSLAEAAAQKFVDASHKVGRDIYLSALHAALHVEGVDRVQLAVPLADVVVSETQAAHCTNLVVSAEVAS